MFDLPADNRECNLINGNSSLAANKEEIDMNLSTDKIINCPSILKGMSHEMRTHMNAIVAFSFLMKENCSNFNNKEDFSKQILSSCEQLLGLFDSFLDSAILETGNSNADSKFCKFDTLLDDLFTEFREIINKEGHEELELVTEIRFSNSTEVFIEQNRIFRVIRSLFQNSIKNTKSGYIKIGYQVNDNQVTFYVLDSGQGYFKCKEFLYTKNMNESLSLFNDTQTAINMTLAKKLIQLLNGTIRIERNGLTGTGIYFSVPAKLVFNNEVKIEKYVNTVVAI